MTASCLLGKTIWGSPAGKKRIADRLVKLLPAHRTYVEPFAGSAAVLFAKDAAEREVIGDADPDIAKAYRLIKRLGAAELGRLGKRDWVGRKSLFKELVESSPTDDLEWLYRFLYVTHFSYGKLRGKSFSPTAEGVRARTPERLAAFAPRLRKVRIHAGDYERIVRKFDSPATAFFLDPPYAGYDVQVGEDRFDEARFAKILEGLKGKFVLTYGTRGQLPQLLTKAGFQVRRIRTTRSIRSMRGVEGPKLLTQLLVTNFEPARKQLETLHAGGWRADDVAPALGDSGAPFAKSIPLLKGADPTDERYVLGVVLEPERVDGQGDIYSPDEVRKAAHRFMQEFGGLGLMHRLRVNDEVKILESYLAPIDFQVGDVPVKKGTWLFAVRVLSDDLWEQVRGGKLTGFSIGGSARRTPECPPESGAEPDAAEGAS